PRTAPPADMFGNRRTIGGLGIPKQKAKNFKGTLVRLLDYLRPHRAELAVVILAGAIGTIFSVLGPKILGKATTKVFEGFVAKASGVPGAAVDFDYVGRLLLGLIALYVIGNGFQYVMQYLMANVAQQTVYAMRREVEAKFDRLPLKFFDARTRGEVMRRRQRSGQHQRHAAAEPHAAADLGADADRHHRHDAHDQLDPDDRRRPDPAAEHR